MYVLATFPDRASAEHAMRDLEGAGFARAGMTLALSSQPSWMQGGALLTVDAGDRSDDARMLLRENNAINLQDAGEVVPLPTHTPLSATPTGPANAAAPNQAAPANSLPPSATPNTDPNTIPSTIPPANAEANIEMKSGTDALSSANIVPPVIPIVTPPPSALGGMNVVGPDLATFAEEVNATQSATQGVTQSAPTPAAGPEATPAPTHEASPEATSQGPTQGTPHQGSPQGTPTQEPRVPGLDPAASTDALAGGGGLLPPVDDPYASENTNPEMHPTT